MFKIKKVVSLTLALCITVTALGNLFVLNGIGDTPAKAVFTPKFVSPSTAFSYEQSTDPEDDSLFPGAVIAKTTLNNNGTLIGKAAVYENAKIQQAVRFAINSKWAQKNVSAYKSTGVLKFSMYAPRKGIKIGVRLASNNKDLKVTKPYIITTTDSEKWEDILIPFSDFSFPDNFVYEKLYRIDIFVLPEQKETDNDAWAVKETFKFADMNIWDKKPGKPIAPDGITLDKTTATIATHATVRIEPTVTPENATNKTVRWESSDEAIATVDTKGVVKGISDGTVTITAKTAMGGYTASCTVKVYTPDPNEPPKALWTMGTYIQADTAGVTKNLAKIEGDPRFDKAWEFGVLDPEKVNPSIFGTANELMNISSAMYEGVLRFWVKVPRNNTAFTIKFTSKDGSEYSASELEPVVVVGSDGWQRIEIKMSDFVFKDDFCFEKLERVQISPVKTEIEGATPLQSGDTIKIAGLQVYTKPPVDPEAPKYDPVIAVDLSPSSETMTVGDRTFLNYNVYPKTADQGVVLSNSNPEAVMLSSSGEILALKEGTAIITVRSDWGGLTETCKITVNPIPADEASRIIYEVNYLKGQWDNARDKTYGISTTSLDDNDENYFRFQRYTSFIIKNEEEYYKNISSHYMMFFGTMFPQGHYSRLKDNLSPYLETATVRFWMKTPREGMRITMGLQDFEYGIAHCEVVSEKANEWVEYQIPLKDFIAKDTKKLDLTRVRHVILSVSREITDRSDPAALHQDEQIDFGYIQVWSKEAKVPVYTVPDYTRVFTDPDNDAAKIIDRNLIMPADSELRLVESSFDNKKIATGIDVYVINKENGRKIKTTYEKVELWIKSPEGSDTANLSMGSVNSKGKITALESRYEDGYIVANVDTFGSYVLMSDKLTKLPSMGDYSRIEPFIMFFGVAMLACLAIGKRIFIKEEIQ